MYATILVVVICGFSSVLIGIEMVVEGRKERKRIEGL